VSGRRSRLLGIRGRFALPIAATVLVTGLSLAAFIHGTVSRGFEQELERRSYAMVSELVQRSTPEAVRGDLAALDLVVRDIAARQDVSYVAVIGNSGEVLASSFPRGLPRDLVEIFERPRAQPDAAVAFMTVQGEVHDLAGLLIDGHLGTVHLGLRQERIRQQAAHQSLLVIAHTAGGALLATMLALLTAHLVTKPLRALAEAADRVGTEQAVELPTIPPGDELGSLAQAMEAMLERLDQKQAQIDAANRLVVQAERMAVVGQLAAGVAHEIGNPLHAAKQFLTGLEERPEEAARYRDLLNQALDRMDKVISQLLSYSAERRMEILPTTPEEMIHQAIDFMRYDHRTRQVELVAEVEPELPQVLVDPSAMQQVLVNLMVNALDALSDLGSEGRVILSATRNPDTAGGPSVLFRVTDNGPGVPKDIAARLFDPFFTTKNPGRGTGLGLSVSQELLAAMGGGIELHSAANGGASFELRLPAQEDS
jgi:two-component system NtrC family sensor kinase